ncbi:MAG: hypothetical protein AAF611_01945 [Bacteroidota bacterium]
MQYSFFRYFLLTYFACLAPVCVGVLPKDDLSWQEKTGLILLLPLGLAIVLAPIFYGLHPKLHKRHRRKKLKKQLFQTFIKTHGFTILEDGFLMGRIDNYGVVMHAEYSDFQHNKWIEIQVIFNPKRANNYIPNAFVARMIRKFSEKEVSWYINSVIIKKQYNLKLPKYEIIYPLVKRCISELKANHIEPISYLEWKALIPTTQNYLDKQKKV